MRAITMTVYMMIEDDQNPRKWNVGEWLDDSGVVGWDIEDGHPDGCAGCAQSTHLDWMGAIRSQEWWNLHGEDGD